jgi:hypothetical protein
VIFILATLRISLTLFLTYFICFYSPISKFSKHLVIFSNDAKKTITILKFRSVIHRTIVLIPIIEISYLLPLLLIHFHLLYLVIFQKCGFNSYIAIVKPFLNVQFRNLAFTKTHCSFFLFLFISILSQIFHKRGCGSTCFPLFLHLNTWLHNSTSLLLSYYLTIFAIPMQTSSPFPEIMFKSI